ncbi:ribulose-phosphate 3-epimerase [Patescibacteria group bacterium]
MEICPSILAHTEEEFRRKVERVRPLGLRLHVDVMDGQFVEAKTWAEASEMIHIVEELPFRTHLMVSNPEHSVPVWSVSGAEMVYFHFESTYRSSLIIRAAGRECDIGIAVNPRTPISRIAGLLPEVKSVLVMTVEPGRGGQLMDDSCLLKVKQLKTLRPELHVAVDGGVKPMNIAHVARVGADTAVVGSALTDVPDPSAALHELEAAVRNMESA